VVKLQGVIFPDLGITEKKKHIASFFQEMALLDSKMQTREG